MNKIINKFLLARDKFMPEMHLRRSRITYSACGPFTKNKKKKYKNLKQEGIQVIFIKSSYIKPAFNVMAYEDFKD